MLVKNSPLPLAAASGPTAAQSEIHSAALLESEQLSLRNRHFRKMKYFEEIPLFLVVFFIFFGGFLPCTACAHSDQENSLQKNGGDSQKVRFQPPYPFLNDELLDKLLRVVMLPEGHITRRQAENAFGIKIPEDKRVFSGPRQPGIHYLAIEGVDWYFPVGVIDGSSTKTSSTFSFEIGKMGLRYPNVCISEKMASEALSQGGWNFKEAPPTPQWAMGPFKSYTKGALGKAILLFATNGPTTCLESILIVAEYQNSSK